MKHQHIQKMLPAFVLGELDGANAEQIRTHLANCAECRRLAHQMKLLLQSSERIKTEPFDESLPALARRRLQEAMDRLQESPSRFRRLWQPLFRYAAAAAIIVVAILALYRMGPQTLPDHKSLTADTQLTTVPTQVPDPIQKELAQIDQALQKRDLETLTRLLQSEHETIRLMAADALAQIGDPAVLTLLDKFAQEWTETSENPYQKAAQAIRDRLHTPADESPLSH